MDETAKEAATLIKLTILSNNESLVLDAVVLVEERRRRTVTVWMKERRTLVGLVVVREKIQSQVGDNIVSYISYR